MNVNLNELKNILNEVEVYLSGRERRLYDRLKADMVLKLEDEK